MGCDRNTYLRGSSLSFSKLWAAVKYHDFGKEVTFCTVWVLKSVEQKRELAPTIIN